MLQAHEIAVTLVDVQVKLTERMHEPAALVKNLSVLLRASKTLAIPVLWMEQIPAKMGPTVEPLREILVGQAPIAKQSFSCFAEPDCTQALEDTGRRTIILAGIEAHVCVYQSAMDLIARGHAVHIVADCVSSRTADNRQWAFTRLQQAGALITTTEMLIFELLGTAAHPQFKNILSLVK